MGNIRNLLCLGDYTFYILRDYHVFEYCDTLSEHNRNAYCLPYLKLLNLCERDFSLFCYLLFCHKQFFDFTRKFKHFSSIRHFWKRIFLWSPYFSYEYFFNGKFQNSFDNKKKMSSVIRRFTLYYKKNNTILIHTRIYLYILYKCTCRKNYVDFEKKSLKQLRVHNMERRTHRADISMSFFLYYIPIPYDTTTEICIYNCSTVSNMKVPITTHEFECRTWKYVDIIQYYFGGFIIT